MLTFPVNSSSRATVTLLCSIHAIDLYAPQPTPRSGHKLHAAVYNDLALQDFFKLWRNLGLLT